MITTQSIINRCQELMGDKNKLKEFNKQNFTDIAVVEVFSDGDNAYTVNFINKYFIFSVDMQDEDGHCCYHSILSCTMYNYEFDGLYDNLGVLWECSGEAESRDAEEMDNFIAEMFPGISDCIIMREKIRGVLKIKKDIVSFIDAAAGNDELLKPMFESLLRV